MNARREKFSDWLYFAGEDLRSAELLLKEGIYSQACFHAHQCAEKCLKAFAIFRELRFGKIHDLNELFEICAPRGGEGLKQFEKELSVLNMFYIPVRYPDGIPGSLSDRLPGKQDAKESFATAEKVHAYITTTIKQSPTKSSPPR